MKQKQKFECMNEDCGHTWRGKPIEERKTVNYDDDDNALVKCPNCMRVSGRVIGDGSGSVGVGGDVEKTDEQEGEVPSSVSSAEKAVEDKTRTMNKLKEAKETEDLYKEAVGGSDSSDYIDKILRYKMLEMLDDSDNSSSVDELKSELSSLKSELRNLKNGDNSNSKVQDKILDQVIGSLDLEGQLAGNGGISGEDLQKVLDRFERSSSTDEDYPEGLPPETYLDLKTHQREMDIKREQMKQREDLIDQVFSGLQNFAAQYGENAGRGMMKYMDQKNNQQQPNSSQQQREKLDIQPDPVVEDGNLQGFEFDCPSCNSRVLVEPGANAARCESCGEIFTLAPTENSQKEEALSNA